MKKQSPFLPLLSLPFLYLGFLIFTEETNYLSLWFGALSTAIGAILLGIFLSSIPRKERDDWHD